MPDVHAAPFEHSQPVGAARMGQGAMQNVPDMATAFVPGLKGDTDHAVLAAIPGRNLVRALVDLGPHRKALRDRPKPTLAAPPRRALMQINSTLAGTGATPWRVARIEGPPDHR